MTAKTGIDGERILYEYASQPILMGKG